MAEILSQIALASLPSSQWDPNKVLLLGQKGIETDTKLEKTGDGITTWANLPYLRIRPSDIIGEVAGVNGTVIIKGTWDASTGLFPTPTGLKKGWAYIVNVGGVVDNVTFSVDNLLIALSDCACSNAYTGNWYRINVTDLQNSDLLAGVEVITNKSTNIGVDLASNIKYPSVKAVYDWCIGLFATIDSLSNYSLISNKSTSIITDQYSDIKYPSVKSVYDWVVGSFATIASLSAYAKLSVAQSFTKAQRSTPVVISSTSGITNIDFDSSNNFTLTLSENTSLSNPTNMTVGQSGQITVIQHSTSAKTLTFSNYWKSVDGTTQTVSTTLNAINLITYYVNSNNHITFNLIKHGVS